MKRFVFIIFTLLIVCSGISAKRISEQDAFSIAEKFMSGKSIKAHPRLLSGFKSSPASKSYYIFNAEDNGGFVIVSGDDLTPSILGYSNSGNIDLSNIPGNLQWLLDSYDTQISTLTENSTLHHTARSEEREDIPELVKVQWGQGEPYNNNCPTYEGSRCQTGCVATAMAQIVQHHRWPQDELPSIPAYTTLSLGIDLDELPSVVFDWDSMDAVSIAKLMRYCGQAIKMDYTPWASGADIYNVAKALIDVFSFTRKTSLEARGSYSDSEWDDMMYNELWQGRPILYSGESSQAGAHSFVVDGYVDGLYHLNWGWEGIGDGFFTLDTLNPQTEQGFTIGQTALINAYPADPEEEKNIPLVKVTRMDCSERKIFRNSHEEDFSMCAFESFYENTTGKEMDLEVGMALYEDDDLLRMVAEVNVTLYPYAGGSLGTQTCITSDIPVGDYKLITVYRLDSSETWLPLADSDKVYIEISISDKELAIQPYPSRPLEEDVFDLGMHTVDGIKYRLRAEYGKYLAYPQPREDENDYVGDLFIPDFISHDGIEYIVSNNSGFADGLLNGNSGIISLSTPIAFSIQGATGLKSIEFREGVTASPIIEGCPELETIKFDAVSLVGSFNECENLKSITLNNTHEIKLRTSDDAVVWNQEDMPSLSDIYFPSNIPPVFVYANGENAVVVPCGDITVHVPSGTEDVFKTHGWNGWKIVEDQSAVPSKVIWNYCGNDVDRGNGIGYVDRANDVEFAMKVPADYLKGYRNCKITAIEYYTLEASNVEYVFLTELGQDYYTKQPAKKIGGGRMSVIFDKPYLIDGEDKDIFVGIGRHGYIDITWANSDIEENGLWLRVMGDNEEGDDIGKWSMVLANDNCCHPVPITMIIEGDDLPDDVMIVDASLVPVDENMYSPILKPSLQAVVDHKEVDEDDHGFIHLRTDGETKNQKKKENLHHYFTRSDQNDGRDCILLKMRNLSSRTVRNVTLDWILDGKKMAPLSLNKVLPQNFNESVLIDFPEGMSGRSHSVEFNVSEIEGKPDTITYNNNVSYAFSEKPSTYFPRKFVMEEATGTWCGYCPSGLATIERMKEIYPENFIAIGVHSDAEMSIMDDSYKPFLDKVSSFPSALLNRMQWVDLSPFSLDSELENGVAMIIASASFAEGNCVDVVTETTFGFDDFGEDNYRIAYVVVEDNVGPYFQNNNYSDPEAIDDPDGYMNWWIHQKQMVPYVYDDVARSIVEYDGIGGFYPFSIEEGKEYRSSYKLVLPENIDNPEDLRIVTLLIDRATGEILNADSTGIEGEYNSVSAINKENDIRIRINENSLIIENAIGKDVVVNRIDGVSVALVRASSNYESLRLQEGVYLVYVGGEVSKVMIK